MLDFLQYASGIAIIAMLLRVCIVDFRTLQISNRSVLVLIGLYVLWLIAVGAETLATDLLIGAVLFGIAFVMWLLRAMGAGDVKLYFALGLLLGIQAVGPFVVLLILVSLLFWLTLLVATRATAPASQTLDRLRYFRTKGVVPYGVIMTIAAIPPLLFRLFS